jgi:diketogulonate reductase-like aldo/keto reductase
MLDAENAAAEGDSTLSGGSETNSVPSRFLGCVQAQPLTNYYGNTVVAIPGASKPHHAHEAAGAMRITLSQQETQTLAVLSSQVSR